MEKSIDDIEFRKLVLKMYDEGYSKEEIIKELEIKKSLFEDIFFTFKHLDINKKIKNENYTEKEIEFIKENIDKDIQFFIVNLERRYNSVQSKIYKIKKRNNKDKKVEENIDINKGKRFIEEEIEFIREAANNGDSVKDIAIALGRSERSIYVICHNNNIKNKKYNAYTEEEIEFIRDAINNGFTYKEIGMQIGRSGKAVCEYCRRNKIKKDPDIIPDGYKRCYRCGKIKQIEDFYKNKNKKDGLYSQCKNCIDEYHKNYYNKEKKKNGK